MNKIVLKTTMRELDFSINFFEKKLTEAKKKYT